MSMHRMKNNIQNSNELQKLTLSNIGENNLISRQQLSVTALIKMRYTSY